MKVSKKSLKFLGKCIAVIPALAYSNITCWHQSIHAHNWTSPRIELKARYSNIERGSGSGLRNVFSLIINLEGYYTLVLGKFSFCIVFLQLQVYKTISWNTEHISQSRQFLCALKISLWSVQASDSVEICINKKYAPKHIIRINKQLKSQDCSSWIVIYSNYSSFKGYFSWFSAKQFIFVNTKI